MKIQWSLIAALLFALITAVFAVINVNPVSVNLLFGTVNVPLILLIIGCSLIGGLIVGTFGIYRQYQMQKEIRSLAEQLIHIRQATGYTPEVQAAKEEKKKEQQDMPVEP
ncbi:LapA family protein [Paenibacillus solani]|uniref:LapA family protein n=1 Tax=Paenibacillus solani TaxID=1705565 RepID=UPI003D2CE0DB